MSDTPRTDAELKRVADQLDGGEDNAAYVLSQFGAHACMLEREVEKLREALDVMTAAFDRNDVTAYNWAAIRKARAALKETK
jgi:hypothetical protein